MCTIGLKEHLIYLEVYITKWCLEKLRKIKKEMMPEGFGVAIYLEDAWATIDVENSCWFDC